MPHLDGEVGGVARFRHARDAGNAAPDIVADAGWLGVGPQRALLHHPEIGAAVVDQHLAVVDHAAIDAGHGQGDADEQPQPDSGENEFPPVMKDVTPRQADHRRPRASGSTIRIRVRAVRPRWL